MYRTYVVEHNPFGNLARPRPYELWIMTERTWCKNDVFDDGGRKSFQHVT